MVSNTQNLPHGTSGGGGLSSGLSVTFLEQKKDKDLKILRRKKPGIALISIDQFSYFSWIIGYPLSPEGKSLPEIAYVDFAILK